MEELLALVIADCKKKGCCQDVSGKLWVPGSPRVERCPEGCHLDIYEMPTKWKRVPGYDVYRQIRICRTHRFARIYLVSGLTAAAYNWDLLFDMKRPDFTEAQKIRVFKDPLDPKDVNSPSKSALRVSVQYHGLDVHLLAEERLGNGEYKGAITGFWPPGETCQDLKVGEEVIFRASSISWIFK
ncbi:MAG: hypothetical protein CVU57_04165 [Deltaproteobacteria bacterium HGW-Deltaproteobacteria-15]|jgi:hypothetical protein|nr:MAG: hypothetical protein CVU57_04165 [Deltaproteobacteria bacterium HGW-Deltaproteobacteria-15]